MIEKADIEMVKNEVRPFLRDSSVLTAWDKEYFLIQCDHIKFL